MSKIRSIEENKMNVGELDLGLLFAKWLTNNRGLDFDSYVEAYKNKVEFKKEVERQIEIVKYNEIKGERKNND